MFKANDNYLKLPGSYLFSDIAARIEAYGAAHPDKAANIVRLGIGDVTQPLVPSVVKALHEAVDEMGNAASFRGYAPDLGYDFLRETIVRNDFGTRGAVVYADEVFVSDGAKSDCGNIQEIFSADARIAVCDPVYPVYVDSNVMAGRTGTYDAETGLWSDVAYMPCVKENGFAPELPDPDDDVALIYLCFPNNPTGAAIAKPQLQAWVDYANEHGAVIIYDAAYEAYISDPALPHSIYECDGARTCAIEIRSFSKNAGFTGTRLGYTVVPHDLKDANGVSMRDLWARRHGTKFNGAPYIVQRAGQAVYSEQGKRETREQILFYMENARIIREGLAGAGYQVFGGVNAPYIWLATPEGMGSWQFFDQLLDAIQVVGTPGAGFGPSGEGYLRLTAFGSRESALEAVRRIRAM